MSKTNDIPMASTTTLVTDSIPDLTEKETLETPKKSIKDMTFSEKVGYAKEVITVEPIIACYVFASIICSAALNNLELEKACRVNAQMNDSICEKILAGQVDNLTEEYNTVQRYITDMHSWQVPVQSVMPLILVLFLGSYSDRHHLRKPFMLLPIFGEFFSVAACILCVVYMKTWPLEALGVSQTVIPSLFGGQTMLIMAIFSYIADVSTLEMRTLRVGVIQITINVFLLVAQPISGVLFINLGYIGTFCIACLVFVLAMCYGVFWVHEKRQETNVFENGVKGCLLDVFNPAHAVETFGMLVVKKEGTHRVYVCTVMVIMFILSGVVVAEFSVMFLYTVGSYGWTAVEFTYYLTVATALYLVGAAVALPLFTRVLKLHDLLIMAISFIDKIAAIVIIAFAKTPTWLYVGTVVGIIQREAQIGIRSFITKIVAEDDMGKAQSLFGIMEAAAPAILGPIFNQLYAYTQETFKGAAFLLGAALFAVATFIALFIYFRGNVDKNKVENKNDKLDGDSTKTVPISDVQTTHI